MIPVLPIVEELRLMKHFIEGEKMMSMLTRNLGKEDTRCTLATCTIVSSCQDVSPAGSRRCSCLGARIRTVRVCRWRPYGRVGELVSGSTRVTFFFGSV